MKLNVIFPEPLKGKSFWMDFQPVTLRVARELDLWPSCASVLQGQKPDYPSQGPFN